MNLLERIGLRRDDLTESEQALARYVAMNYAGLAYEPAAQIAQKCDVSAATATRFFTKLGYDSFADVQREVREQIEQRLSSPLGRLGTKASNAESMTDLVAQTMERDLRSIQAAGAGMQPSRIIGMAEILVQSKGTLYVYGEKKAHAVAFYLYAQLNLCLGRVVLLTSEQSLLADRLLQVGSDDSLLVIDVRRYVRSTLYVAQTFSERSGQVLLLGDSEASPLAAMASFGIYCPVEGASLFDSYAALMFAANALSNVVAAHHKAEIADRLKEAEKLWSRFETFVTIASTDVVEIL
ncbi:MurR/RpiR family transcriptional regulator [Azospirillum sp.]|uniref:MurR/RpiR family transcriptional regulator n=1 Tax=Azospirillum sp. TaxID=34012 RepID=UPI0026277DF1|nr:MurR/RpiR family transcriptional regulator [Azospirillum sp.]